ncbi:hypothetical protein [Streptomyces sp. NPDC005283]
MLGIVAEFGAGPIRMRTREGMAVARAEGHSRQATQALDLAAQAPARAP